MNGDARAAAVAEWQAAAAAGREPSGVELAARFGRSPSWGRAVVREARILSGGAPGAQHERRRPWWATLVTVAVGLIAAAASYGHQLEVALEAGEPELIAHAVPLTVDGLVIAALWAGRGGRSSRWRDPAAWWLGVALVVSMAANVAAAEPTPLGYAVAAWPPVALFGTHQLLHAGAHDAPARSNTFSQVSPPPAGSGAPRADEAGRGAGQTP